MIFMALLRYTMTAFRVHILTSEALKALGFLFESAFGKMLTIKPPEDFCLTIKIYQKDTNE